MYYRKQRSINLQDIHSECNSFHRDVLAGLQKQQKELPAKYFYDESGSQLFESICMLEEYYIPQTEIAIMRSNIEEIVDLIGERIVLIEYGCGDCAKTRVLLNNLTSLSAYIPVDISRGQLTNITEKLVADYPQIEVLPVCADYYKNFSLPVPKNTFQNKVVYFPGSSIGNFEPDAAVEWILLIGVDLKKDPDVLHSAYNDDEGMTAAFNLNILKRINNELKGDFQLEYFEHCAFYNHGKGRVEMHLVSTKKQVVHLGNLAIKFAKGESIWTESSYKYYIEEFEHIANSAGFALKRAWTDEKQWFGILC